MSEMKSATNVLNPSSRILPSCTASAVEDLIDMLSAVLMGCLEILEFLA
jgi:hypothetical protein